MTNLQKALVIFATSFIIFMIIKPRNKGVNKERGGNGVDKVNRKPIKLPVKDTEAINSVNGGENAWICLSAFVDAYNSGADAIALEELNEEMRKDYDMSIVTNGTELSGLTIIVKNGKGNDILKYVAK